MSSGRFLGGLLIGGALGTIIGLLVAPRSGDETRELIREELSERMNRSVAEAKHRASELSERARDKAEELRERGQAIAAELEEVGRETMGRIRSTVKTGREPGESNN